MDVLTEYLNRDELRESRDSRDNKIERQSSALFARWESGKKIEGVKESYIFNLFSLVKMHLAKRS